MDHRALMNAAIQAALDGIAIGQTPFGSSIAESATGRLIAVAHNTVWRDHDPTAHAEVNCLRHACASLRTIDLSGHTLFTTCEPCPMCLAAIHWAKVDRIVYGATIADAADAGFRELPLRAEALATMGRSHLVVERGPLRDQCVHLFQRWRQSELARSY